MDIRFLLRDVSPNHVSAHVVTSTGYPGLNKSQDFTAEVQEFCAESPNS